MKMSVNWASNGLCRCCHKEGTFLGLSTTNSRDISKHIYAEVMKETFGIQMQQLPDSIETYTICDKCISKLQDASEFKQQVLLCEDIFMKWYDKVKSKVAEDETVKLEISEPVENSSDPIDCSDGVAEQIWLELPAVDSDVSDMKTEKKAPRKKKINKQKAKSVRCKYYRPPYKHQCNVCGLKFAYDRQLINHTSIRHPEEKYTCSICQETFQNTSEVKKHLVSHIKKKKCPVCQKVLNKNCLNEHLKSHEDPRFVCDVCGKMFWQHSQLYRHSTVHTGVKPYTCDLCNKKFTRKYTLEIHKRRHNGEKPYKCDVCEKTFADPSAKMVHMRLHSGSKPYSCSFCSFSFTHLGTLRRHERTHTGERPYSCNTCGKQFGSSSAIKPHMRTHTGEKPFKCDLCNQAFSEKKSLERHLNTHNGVKPYTCRICNKQISCLNKHMRVVHSGEKPFQCSVCDKRFADRGYLKLHLRIHTGERPFCCFQCGRRFTQSHVLKNHRCGYTEVNGRKEMTGATD